MGKFQEINNKLRGGGYVEPDDLLDAVDERLDDLCERGVIGERDAEQWRSDFDDVDVSAMEEQFRLFEEWWRGA